MEDGQYHQILAQLKENDPGNMVAKISRQGRGALTPSTSNLTKRVRILKWEKGMTIRQIYGPKYAQRLAVPH